MSSNISNKNFGFFFSVVFFILFLFFFILKKTITFLLLLSIFFLVMALALPGYLYPLNKLWESLGKILHFIFSKIIIFIFFFFIVSVLGLIMKLFGYDPFLLRKKQQTYWKKRKEEINSLVDMF